ncbi:MULTISPECIES: sugar transferase [Hymenobacter]|uniref:Exopolysaccharide biosynthesis polyprenyl glycosylphosphotransferase n=1 Tax=Hymenobacter mucosus TaxID=1411120 RepID=A0A238V4D6_9BACT|nr:MULTISPECIES: sugar transferase [Hymenobacter]SNR29300.1 exopolysaccharide biosynthesis polyprenyl glycosylphosphotransferase [Hymenobacter mucosus]
MIRTFQKLKLIGADFIAALLAWVCFFLLRKYLLSEITEGYHFTEVAFFFLSGSAFMIAAFWTVLYTLIGEYRDIFRKSRLAEIIRLGRVSVLGAVVIFFALLLDDQGVQNYQAYYKTITAYFLLHFLLTAILRVWAISSVQKLVRGGVISFNTLLVGSNTLARDTYQELLRTGRHLGLKIVGVVSVGDTVDEDLAAEVPTRGSYHRLPALIRVLKVEQVVIAIEASEHRVVEEILALLEGTPVRISILPDLYQMLLGSVKVSHVFGTPLIEIKQDLLPVWQKVLKRALDVGVSIVFLLLAWPVYAFTAIMVKLSSPGPVFYSQVRIGQFAQPFHIYKFRSMYVDAEALGPALSSDHDPRITPWGRFMRKVRLDELPQFWNVIKGDMSIVGPRPERQYFIDQIVQLAPHYRHLHRVRPGLTSLGQVKYGYAETVPQMVERLKFDILYIENMSLSMDFRVVLYTLKIIIEGRGK